MTGLYLFCCCICLVIAEYDVIVGWLVCLFVLLYSDDKHITIAKLPPRGSSVGGKGDAQRPSELLIVNVVDDADAIVDQGCKFLNCFSIYIAHI